MNIFEQARERAQERRAQLRRELFAVVSESAASEVRALAIVEREQAQYTRDLLRAASGDYCATVKASKRL